MTDEARTALAERFVRYLDATDDQRQEQVRKAHDHEKRVTGKKTVKVARKHSGFWGTINNTYGGGAGLKFVSCSGHGGVLTSIGINEGIDRELRRVSPWYYEERGVYEEDCESNIVAAYYPKAAEKMGFRYGNYTDTRTGAVYAMIDYFSDEMEAILARTAHAPSAHLRG